MRRHTVPASLSAVALAVAGLAGPAEAAAPELAWGPVTNLSRPDPGTFAPELAVAPDGTAVALWDRGEGQGASLMAAWRRSNGTWSAARRVPHTRGVREPEAAYAGDGTLVVVWSAGRRVRAVRRAPDGTWGDPSTLHRTPTGVRGTIPAYLDLAVNARGRAVVAWSTMDDDQDATYARSRVQAVVGSAGGQWTRVRTLSTPRRDAYDAEVGLSRAGRAVVVWDELNGRRGRIMTSSRTIGETWARPTALSGRLAHAAGPQLAALPSGELAVAWNAGGAQPGIRMRRWTHADGWGAATSVPGVTREVWWLDAGIDGTGTVTLAWSNQAKSVWSARQTSDGAWTRARVAPPGSVFYEVHVVVNAAGGAIVGWDARNNPRDNHRVQAAYRPSAGPWQQPAYLSSATGDAGGVTVALDSQGNATAAWAIARSVRAGSRIQARYLAVP